MPDCFVANAHCNNSLIIHVICYTYCQVYGFFVRHKNGVHSNFPRYTTCVYIECNILRNFKVKLMTTSHEMG